MGANSGPMSGIVRRVVKETNSGVGRRAITEGIMDFWKKEEGKIKD